MPSVPNPFVATAFQARINSDLESMNAALVRLQSDLGIRAGVSPVDALSQVEDALVLEWACLQVSFLRARGQWNLSGALLEAVDKECARRGIASRFAPHFQRGCEHYRRGEFTLALESFLMARVVAEHSWQSIPALANALFCLDYLGLPFEKTHAELLALMGRHPELKETIRGTFEQVEAFDVRQSVARGEFREVLDPARTLDFTRPCDQTSWQRIFLAELPYHVFSGTREGEHERFLSSGHGLPENRYLVRTLLGAPHAEDEENARLHDLADRVYLWTWRWLVDPESFDLRRVARTLAPIQRIENGVIFGSDNYHQLRNALHWIRLFTGDWNLPLRSLLKRAKPYPLRSVPFYEYEARIIELLQARADGRDAEAGDLETELKAHPMTVHPDLRLGSLIDLKASHGDEVWSGFIERVREAVTPVRRRKGGVHVDLPRGRVIVSTENSPETPREIASQSLARAFHVLDRTDRVSIEEFVREVFGYRKFDSAHLPRVFNLLSRMRTMIPQTLRVGVKEGSVYRSGDWSSISIRRDDGLGLAESMQVPEVWIASAPSGTPRTAEEKGRDLLCQLILHSQSHGYIVTRKDVESVHGASRATINRYLESWVKAGYAERIGYSRNIRYRLNPEKL